MHSTVGFVKSRKSVKEIPMVHEGWPVVWTPALHHYACSITIGVDSISSSSQGCQGLLQSVLSLQVSVAMLYYSIVMVSIGVSSGSAS